MYINLKALSTAELRSLRNSVTRELEERARITLINACRVLFPDAEKVRFTATILEEGTYWDSMVSGACNGEWHAPQDIPQAIDPSAPNQDAYYDLLEALSELNKFATDYENLVVEPREVATSMY